MRLLALVAVALVAKSVAVAAAVLGSQPWAALVTVSALPLIALLLCPSLLLRGRGRTAYLLGADLLVSLLLLADLLNARASGRLLSLHMMTQPSGFEGMGSSVWAMARWWDVLVVADLVVLAVLALVARFRGVPLRWPAVPATPPAVRRWLRRGRRARVRAVAFVVVGSVLAFGVQVVAQTSDPRLRVVSLSPLGAHAYEGYEELVDTNDRLTPEERQRVRDWFAANEAYHEVAPEHADLVGLLEGRDLYYVQFESLEQVVLGASPHGQEVTPTLNRWLGESLVFDHVLAQVRDGSSSDAELLALAGVYPVQSGAAFLRFPDNAGYTSLPRLLTGEGYHPIALHNDSATFWNRDRVFPHLGFERYIGQEGFARGTPLGMGLADTDLFDQALRELDRVGSPHYMHLITTSSHLPWELPEHLQELDLPGDDATSRYLQAVHYTDAALGAFERDLRERGLLERSAIIVVGDHEGPHRYAPEDERWLEGNQGRVPFLVYVPGSDGRRISTPGGQIDVLPTLAQLVGIPPERYAGQVMGRTLLGSFTGSAVTPEGEVLPGADGATQLRTAYEIADLAISSEWFAGTADSGPAVK
ncbi:LTA synthase family protein [Ornithinimicrobium cavernae]|uniref:LTA synthase family protein n=1 Tax=Ornithinimicrobium cavernae TaxID=2666047 RepID=UPI000D6943F5|nr:LTA synthase family protein [Ornithinimicrobium cavernae]